MRRARSRRARQCAKNGYPTQEAALLAADRSISLRGPALHVYARVRCSQWHIGHRAGCRGGDVALLAAVSACFALGAATTEAFKHLAAAGAGPLAPGAAADVRVGDARRGPGGLGRVLRR